MIVEMGMEKENGTGRSLTAYRLPPPAPSGVAAKFFPGQLAVDEDSSSGNPEGSYICVLSAYLKAYRE